MADQDDPRRVRLDSARLRALAHPLRSRLLSALRLDGPATSAALAERLQTNTGATSYHLRQLADVGLIEEVTDRGRGRERWWRAAHEVTSWHETDFEDDPDDRAAADWLLGHHVRTAAGWIDDWLASRSQWSRPWRRASSVGDMRLRLTPDQARALEGDLYDVVRRYQDAGAAGPADEGDNTDDVADVMVLIDIFPVRQVRL